MTEFSKLSPQGTPRPKMFGKAMRLAKGEPIVNTPAEAFSTFSRSEMDGLVLENFVLDKTR